MHRECRERFPCHWLQKKPLVSDSGMHHCTCVMHIAWCISVSLTRGGGKNVPGITGACATRNFTYLARGSFSKNLCSVFVYHATITSTGGIKQTLWYSSGDWGYLKLESHEILCVHNFLYSCLIALAFCTEHGNITAVLCSKFKYNWVIGPFLWANGTSRDLRNKVH